MAWTKRKTRPVALAAFLLFAGLLLFSSGKFPCQRRLRLPVGPITPAISLGETHGVILASDGSLWTWGAEFLGWPVLGLGAVTNQPVLRRIGNETNWTSISAAADGNLAVKADGTLWAWGANYRGQLGDGTTTMRKQPAPSAPGHDWKQAATGGAWSLAIKENGTLWAWGNNWSGQLGIDSVSNTFVPMQVGLATNWTRVWARDLQSVGRQSDGSLWVWGDNPESPMGTNSFRIPRRLSPDTNWVDVTFGTYTAFGLKSDGTLWTWGRFARAYAGQRPRNPAELPAAADNTKPITTFFDIHASATALRIGTNTDWKAMAESHWWYQTLLKNDGTLWLMDATEYDDVKSPAAYRPIPFRRIDLPKNIVAFASGNGHAVAPGSRALLGVVLTRDGEVWTWGMVLGERPTMKRNLQLLAVKLAHFFQPKINWHDSKPTIRDQPWQLSHEEE